MAMKVRLITHTPEPEKTVAAAAKLNYSSSGIDELLDGLTLEKSREFVKMLAALGHDSPTEHASFTFGIEGVSRALMAQITRHRIATFSVQSQRYVRMDGFEAVTPPEIADIPEAAQLFSDAMKQEAALYENLTRLLETKHKETYLAEGLEEKQAAGKARKQANEDARFVLPNACATRMIVTMNTRSLNNFFRLRCCNRAQWEIQAVADEMLRLVYAVAPALICAAGPGCCAGGCTEGKMTCGKAAEVREKYAALKAEAGGNG